jgi:hypothetical protein
MGLDLDGFRFFSSARRAGASFDRTLTIGRQEISDHAKLERMLSVTAPASGPDRKFAEWAFAGLGVKALDALDASAFEGAALVHDLNHPIPDAWHGRYDAVIDGGSLEHVFDVRQSLANLMNAARVGGSVFMVTPTNNHMGHGFYQFSPELFFRAFSEANGFRVQRMLLQTSVLFRKTYEVTDPNTVHDRVALIHGAPARLLVHAVKVAQRPVFAIAPQQSDYSAGWANAAAGIQVRPSLRRRLERKVWAVVAQMPPHIRDAVHQWYFRATKYRLGNGRFFRPTSI